ncbi:PREDICTED: inositol 1,4,5-trisphosphate receptor-interacting protein-like 1, partial [Tauraco erythrolophus]|uniref:inositol 1,4,5-trisphosphate receptor-interacting protein-like 1 n=1 Tax=Tauraco erythrolophus TaxID=121530 RepID=UPI0005234AEB
LSSRCRLTLLPSSRSLQIQVTKDNTKRLNIELIFGVQRYCSDVFLCSQSSANITTSSMMWTESYAVAEAEFFRHVARRAPHKNCELKCLQACARILEGTAFSSSTLKTVVMHVLTLLPMSRWRRRDFLPRLRDIMWYLLCCVEHKHLNPFFIANENVPNAIILPLDLRTAEPLNLFQRLAQDPDAHIEALRELMELQDQLIRLLLYGH